MATEKLVLATDVAWQSTKPEEDVLAQVGARLVLARSGSEAELLNLVPDTDAILTNWAQVPASVIQAGRRLQVISRYGIGVDNIAVGEATHLGIPVTNVPEYCLHEVSEHALAMILASAHKVCQYNRSIRVGDWKVSGQAPIYRMHGKVLGLVGFGKIARTLAPVARALGLCILAFDPFVEAEIIQRFDAMKVDLDDLLQQADFVSIHAPLTDQTRGLLNAQRLGQMKPTACLVNTSRGAILDQDALVEALHQHRIAGAALDVFSGEPLPPDHPLFSFPNVILIPHVSFYSEESLIDLETQAAENVAAILSARRPASVVNPKVLDLPRWAHLI
ncbi:MAG: C-terminal binding protein [Anaerolineales bacterium]|jgi:D-3-phosphoglycerate dehydrogenase